MIALTPEERTAVSIAAMSGGLHAVVEAIVAQRLELARTSYIKVLWNWHEAEPDHCGGDCFSPLRIDAAFTPPSHSNDCTCPSCYTAATGGGR